VYEEYRRALVARAYGGPRPPGGVSPLLDLAAGAAAGATAVVLTYPLDLVRTRLAFATEARGAGASAPAAAAAAEAAGAGAAGAGGAAARPLPPPRPSTPPPFRFLPHADPAHSIRGVLSTTLAAEGAAGLYKGLGPSMWGILPYAGLKFFVYQSLKRAHLARAGGGGARPAGGGGAAGGGPRLPVAAMLSYGAAAGVAAQPVTYPLDVVRRRMQVEGLLVGKGGAAAGGGGAAGASGPGGAGGSSTDARLPRSTPAALRAIAARHGWRALYSGLAINYMKVVPSTAIGFAAYDYLKAALDLPSNL
jgi:solute carrier family 25 protein 16